MFKGVEWSRSYQKKKKGVEWSRRMFGPFLGFIPSSGRRCVRTFVFII